MKVKILCLVFLSIFSSLVFADESESDYLFEKLDLEGKEVTFQNLNEAYKMCEGKEIFHMLRNFYYLRTEKNPADISFKTRNDFFDGTLSYYYFNINNVTSEGEITVTMDSTSGQQLLFKEKTQKEFNLKSSRYSAIFNSIIISTETKDVTESDEFGGIEIIDSKIKSINFNLMSKYHFHTYLTRSQVIPSTSPSNFDFQLDKYFAERRIPLILNRKEVDGVYFKVDRFIGCIKDELKLQ